MMTVSELLERVEQAVGRRVEVHVLDHAVRLGYLSPVCRRGGWRFFAEDSVEGLLAYLRERSRLSLSSLEA